MAIEEMYLDDRRRVILLVQDGKYYPWALINEPYNEERILKKLNGRVPAGFAHVANPELGGCVRVYPKVAVDWLPKVVGVKEPKRIEVTKAWFLGGHVFFKFKGERTLVRTFVGFGAFDLNDAYRNLHTIKEAVLKNHGNRYDLVEDGTLGQHNRVSLAGLVQY